MAEHVSVLPMRRERCREKRPFGSSNSHQQGRRGRVARLFPSGLLPEVPGAPFHATLGLLRQVRPDRPWEFRARA